MKRGQKGGNSILKKLYTYLSNPIMLLIFLVIFHGVNNYIVLKQNTTLFTADSATYYLISLERYYSLAQLDLKGFLQVETGRSQYPPLVTIFPIPFYFIFGKSPIVAVMTNILYLTVLIFSVYGIGKNLYNKQAGLTAAFITSVFPIMFGFSRVYTKEFALVSVVCLSVYFLLKTSYFKNMKYSILLGISIGFGMLTRESYPCFIIGPIIYYVYKSFIPELKKSIRRTLSTDKFKNLLISTFFGVAVSSCWYVLFFKNIFKYLLSNIHVSNSSELVPPFYPVGGILSLSNLTYYIKVLLNYQIGPFYLFLFLAYLLSYIFYRIIKKKKFGGVFFLLIWIFIPWIVFTFLMNVKMKDPRFVIPYLPALALVISILSLRFYNFKLKRIILVLIFTIGLIQFFGVTYYPQYRYLFGLNQIDDVPPLYSIVLGLQSPYREDWRTQDIFDTIFKNNDYGDSDVLRILILPFNHNIIDQDMSKAYHDYILNRRNQLVIKTPPLFSSGGTGELNISDIRESIANANDFVIKSNFILVSEGEFQFSGFGQEEYLQFKKSFEKNKNLFDLVKRFDLPDGTTAHLYKKKI